MSSSGLLLDERHRLIRKRLLADGRVLAHELAHHLGVSEDTVRRDLRDLAAAGLCRRVYGGALPVSPADGSLAERQVRAVDAKRSLALAAARLVEPGTTVFIDAGSTNVAIAAALDDDRDLTVVTNAPAVAVALAGRRRIELVLIGGRIDARAGGSVGMRAVADARAIRADRCFLGACGVDAEAGVTAFGFEESLFKQAMIEGSRTVAVAATGDKLGTAAPFAIAPIAAIGELIVGDGADPDQLGACGRRGVRIIRAEGGAS
ncbi:DeoR/GlpR family DNA-binding transcription regulator [Marinivivus vitaminiproducens]|uniref:DeoR/GlpR family DNA-binding transcription regulator n=1 Tax=Marinivivus vitaminiproducens TaxID=3035935 RepID=UPI0027A83FE8|nr:DeoR/GlpR family DNA-binding transcription regulator [Geminicoccaceae bacterium SCSIO 64248]